MDQATAATGDAPTQNNETRKAPGAGLTFFEPGMARRLDAMAEGIREAAGGPDASVEALIPAAGVDVYVPHCICADAAETHQRSCAAWEERIAALADPAEIAAQLEKLDSYRREVAEDPRCLTCRGTVIGFPSSMRQRKTVPIEDRVPSWELWIPEGSAARGDEHVSQVAFYLSCGILRMNELGAFDTLNSDRHFATRAQEHDRTLYLARALLLPAALFLAALGRAVDPRRWHEIEHAAARGELAEAGYGDLPATLRRAFPRVPTETIEERLTDVTRLAFVAEMRSRTEEIERLRAMVLRARLRVVRARRGRVPPSAFFAPAVELAVTAILGFDEEDGLGSYDDDVPLRSLVVTQGMDLEVADLIRRTASAGTLSPCDIGRILALALFAAVSFIERRPIEAAERLGSSDVDENEDRHEAEWWALRAIDLLDGRIEQVRCEHELDRVVHGTAASAAHLIVLHVMDALSERDKPRSAHLVALDVVRILADAEVPHAAWAATCVHDFIADCVDAITHGEGPDPELLSVLAPTLDVAAE